MSSFLFFEHIKHFMTQIVEAELRCTRFALKREVGYVVSNDLHGICAVICCSIILPRNQKAQIKSLAGRCRNMALDIPHIIILTFKDYSIYIICRTLNLSKGTYYHRNKNRPEKTSYQKNDENLKPFIKKCFYDSKERFGGSKIRIVLREQGIQTSQKRVDRLMKEMGLVCKQTRQRVTWATREFRFRSNRLKKNFTQTEPNIFWVSDITFVPIQNCDSLYGICIIIDLFSI